LLQIDEQLSAGQQRLKPTASIDDQRHTVQMSRVTDPWCRLTCLPGVDLHRRCDVMEESISSEPGRQRPASRKTPIIRCRLKCNNYTSLCLRLRLRAAFILRFYCLTIQHLCNSATLQYCDYTTATDTEQQNIYIVTFEQHTNERQIEHRMLTRI